MDKRRILKCYLVLALALLLASCCQAGNGGHAATLVISPLGKPGYQSPIAYDHYSLLRTIEDAWGLPELGDAACDCAPPMADFFVPPAAAERFDR